MNCNRMKMLSGSVQPSKAILSGSEQEAVTYAVGHVFERQR
jgi:hypothetical protein